MHQRYWAGTQRLEYSTAAQTTILAKLVARCTSYTFKKISNLVWWVAFLSIAGGLELEGH